MLALRLIFLMTVVFGFTRNFRIWSGIFPPDAPEKEEYRGQKHCDTGECPCAYWAGDQCKARPTASYPCRSGASDPNKYSRCVSASELQECCRGKAAGVGPRGTPVEPDRAPRSKPKWSSPQQAIDAKMIDEGCTASAMAASEAVRKKCAKFRATLEAELKKIQKRVSSSENSLQLNKHHYVGIAATFVFSWLLWRFCLTQSKATFDQALLEEI